MLKEQHAWKKEEINMTVEVRYQSKSGNTKKVAEAIAGALGVTAKSVDEPYDAEVDLLFVGGALYAGMLSRKLKRFLKALRGSGVKNVAVFSTASGLATIRGKVDKILQGNSNVLLEEFHLRAKDLNAASLEDAAAFAKATAQKLA
jgi:flavodoxin